MAATELLSTGNEFDYRSIYRQQIPFVPKDDGRSFTKYRSGRYDSLFTVSPLVRKLGRLVDGKFVPWNFVFGQRSQDMETLYFENGLLYICHRDLILNGRIRGDSLYSLVVDHPFGSLDIDTKENFEEVEYYSMKYRYFENYTEE